jgi:spermidine/putrescine transport system permease protein
MADRGFSATRLPGFRPIAIAVFIVLYLPIFTLVVYSFNAGNSVALWQGFSFKWYHVAWDNDQVKGATARSLPRNSRTNLTAASLAPE